MDLPPVYCRALRHMEVYSLPGPLSKRIGTKTGLASLARKDAALAKHLPGTFMWNPVTGELDENASREEWERRSARRSRAGPGSGTETFADGIGSARTGDVTGPRGRADVARRVGFKLRGT